MQKLLRWLSRYGDEERWAVDEERWAATFGSKAVAERTYLLAGKLRYKCPCGHEVQAEHCKSFADHWKCGDHEAFLASAFYGWTSVVALCVYISLLVLAMQVWESTKDTSQTKCEPKRSPTAFLPGCVVLLHSWTPSVIASPHIRALGRTSGFRVSSTCRAGVPKPNPTSSPFATRIQIFEQPMDRTSDCNARTCCRDGVA